MSVRFTRQEQIAQLGSAEIFDLIVIGGGASGLGIALEAITRGYSVVLLELCDFAKGTSSKSTKLVHGGVRYLAQGNLQLVREASIERAILLKNAPHLVKNTSFLLPVYSIWEQLKYSIGLKLYSWIAGKYSLASSHYINKEQTLQRMPAIKSKNLRGSIQYQDGQFDDARLSLNLAQSIVARGGITLNYFRVTGLTKNENGHINAVDAVDVISNVTYSLKAKAVVNATGVFANEIQQMDGSGEPLQLRFSQGVHVVLDKSFFPSSQALMIPKTSDGRVLFAVPWHKKVVLGTTDTPVQHALPEPIALEEEIDFILKTAAQYLTKAPARQDVLSVFAGLRPLAAAGKGSEKTKEISRSHKIEISPSQLFTMIGGKWTTYRKMGEDMIDAIEQHLKWRSTLSMTAQIPLYGATPDVDFNDDFYFYGADKVILEQRMLESSLSWLSMSMKLHAEQVVWAVEHEMAMTVEDVLARRTRLLFLHAQEARRVAPQVAAIMASLMGKNAEWVEQQIEHFNALADNYQLT